MAPTGTGGGTGGAAVDALPDTPGTEVADAAPDTPPDSPDLGTADAGTDLGGGDASASTFSLLVTETPPGSPAQSAWEGILRFTLAADGAPLVPVAGIAAAQVADPDSLGFRTESSELFVGNRHGNAAGQGTISRFTYDSRTGELTPNGTITGNGLSGVSQIAFHPVTGEMFVANYNGAAALSRFTFDTAGNATANGTLGTGATQGVAITPDGQFLYATSGGAGGNTIRRYDLSNGAVSTAATISTATRLFYMAIRDDDLYVAAVDGNAVYRLTIDVQDGLTLKGSIDADGAIAIAFSPSGREMFTSGHLTTNVIDTFSYDDQTGGWTKTAAISTPSSLAGVLTLPGGPPVAVIDGGTPGDGTAPDGTDGP